MNNKIFSIEESCISLVKNYNGEKFKTIYADPPWLERGAGKIKRGADKHYSLMNEDEIAALRILVYGVTQEQAHLYLWVTNNFLPQGLRILQIWGFRYVTKIDWFKDRIGLGQYYRGKTESCLFGVKGRALPYRVDKVTGKRSQGVTGFEAPRMLHSQKPEKMRQMIEKVSHGPYLERVARHKTQGWSVWGSEVGEGITS